MTKLRPLLDVSAVLDQLAYEKETGVFTWKVSPSKNVKPGDVAGYKMKTGVIGIQVCGYLYLAHRLAFVFMTGAMPENLVDHINGVRSDNRWNNLRAATQSQNMQNLNFRKPNSSGFLGVTKYSAASKRKKLWRATIIVNGVRKHLGSFYSAEKAVAAYTEAKQTIHTFNPRARGQA